MAELARPHIGLVIDHPERDLPTVAMIALALCRRGCSVSIVPLYDQGLDVPLLGLDALVTTFARPANLGLAQTYSAMGIALFVLDTEGGVLAPDGPNSPANLARYVKQSGWADLLSGYFFWGAAMHEAFRTEGTLAEEHLHLTGCPRFDPASPRLRAMLSQQGVSYILVNTAFPIVNSRFSADGEDKEAMTSAGWDAEYVGQLTQDNRKAMSDMIALVKRLALRFPEERFLLRPHPFERTEPYESGLMGLPNIIVDGTGGVLGAIANARCVVQLNCSTAIEALMLEKLPLSPDFVSTPALRAHSPLPNAGSWQMESEAHLCEVLSDIASAEQHFDFADRYRRLAEPYFHYNDGLASERIADILSTLPPACAPASLRKSMSSSLARPSLGQRVQAVMATLVGSRSVGRLRALWQKQRSAKRLDLDALSKLLASASQVAGVSMPELARHRHPYTRAPMSSISISPAKAPTGDEH